MILGFGLLNKKIPQINALRKVMANPEYYPCYMVDENRKRVVLLMTLDQLNVAKDRANKNKEDVKTYNQSTLGLYYFTLFATFWTTFFLGVNFALYFIK